MKKILLIGSLNLFWFRKILENVVVPIFGPENIWVLTEPADEANKTPYTDKGIQVLTTTAVGGRLSFLTGLLKDVAKVRAQVHFDYIHVQYVSFKSLLLARLIQQRGTKLLATFWGSDISVRDDRTVKRLDFLLKGFDEIIATAARTEYVARGKLSAKNVAKLCTIGLGLESLDTIHTLKKSGADRDQIRETMGIPTDAVTVAVGYNARPMQQHLPVLNALGTLPPEIKEKLFIMLPMTYLREGNEAYIDQVRSTCEAQGFRYREFDRFMVDPENSYLRMSADIYINAQESDALSGSVLEFMYSGAVMLNGEWLNYPGLREQGLVFYEFDEFSHLPDMITDYLDGKISCGSEESLEAIYRGSGWKNTADKHRTIYKMD